MNVKRVLMWFMILVFVFVVGFVVVGFAGEKEKQHSIDVWLGKCIELDSSTAGMTNCSSEATTMWDKEMNKVYKELMKKLPEKQKTLLKQSQIQWLKFRDSENNFIDEFYGNFEGTIWQNILTAEKLGVVKERTLNLQIYFNYLKEK